MVDHDGCLTGTPKLNTDVCLVLVPGLEGTFGANNGFATVADTWGSAPASTYSALSGFSSDPHGMAISVTTLWSSALDDFLLCGEHRQAYDYELDEKLWEYAKYHGLSTCSPLVQRSGSVDVEYNNST